MTARLRIALIILSFIYIGNAQILFSQSSDFIEGKVINSVTGKPVPFATIKLKTNQLGVYANADGDFKISRNTDFQDDSVMFTCIGFKQSSLAYKDLSEITVNKVFLSPVVYGLSEVKIIASRKKLSALALIRRAIRNISKNYPGEPFNFIAYYRDYQKKDSTYINLNEAIVQTLDNGFGRYSGFNMFRLIDFRKNTDFPRMHITPYYDSMGENEFNSPKKIIPNAVLGDQYGNELFVLMVHDALRNYNQRSFSFVEIFIENFILNHIFSDPVTVLDNNLPLSKISFTGRPFVTGDSLGVSGAIYIQPNDYSIHKLEYSGYSKSKNKGINQIYNIDIEYGYENSMGSKMFLKYISFNNLFKITDSTDYSYFRVLGSTLDMTHNIMPSVVITFNNPIDRKSASKKENFAVTIGKKAIKINSIQVVGKTLYLRFKKENLRSGEDKCKVELRDIKDTDGNIVNKLKTKEYHQYRELFVQEYNKSLPFTDSCYVRYLPLEQNCISKHSGNFNYWMNTPENIRKIK